MLKRITLLFAIVGSLLIAPPAFAAEDDPRIQVSLLSTSRSVFDPGVHLFIESSYVPTLNVRAAYQAIPNVSIDWGYSFSELSGSPGGAGALLTSHIIEAGVRYDLPRGLGPIVPYARAGGTFWMARTHFKDVQRYQEWSNTFGAYGAGGLRLGTTLRDTLGSAFPNVGVAFTAEVGHLETFGDLEFGPFGTLETGGVFFAYGIDVQF